MLVKVKFHGILKKFCEKAEYIVDAETPEQAIRAVTNQIEKLKRHYHRFVVRAKECQTKNELFSPLKSDELNLIPDFSPAGGGGNSGTTQIIIGAVILAVVVIVTIATWGTATPGLVSALWTVGGIGAGFVLGGTISLLMQQKARKDVNDPDVSSYFSVRGNTVKTGTRIAIGYGKYRVYGHLLSLGTQTSKDYAVLNR